MISVCDVILIQGHFPWVKRERVCEGNLIAPVSANVVGGDVSVMMLCKMNALFFLGGE